MKRSRRSLQEIGDFDAVIHVGLNENAEKIRLEMCTINGYDFRGIPDNQGRMIQESFVDDSGLALHFLHHHSSSFDCGSIQRQ